MIHTRPTPSIEYLREILLYDEFDGTFTWKVTMSPRAKGGYSAGSVCRRGYLNIKIDGVTYRAGRIAWKAMTGEEPDIIDHINNDTLDNRWCNLRSVSQRENTHNRSDTKRNGGFGRTYYYKHRSGRHSVYTCKEE